MWPTDRVLAVSHEWQWFPPGAEELLIDDIVVIDYPEWASMGFYATPTLVADPRRSVEHVCGEARRRGRLETEWWLTPSTRPDELEGLLVAQGAVRSDVVNIMALDMSEGVPAIPVPEDVRAVVVTDARCLEDAELVAASVWGREPSQGDRREAQLRSLGDPLDERGAFRVVAYSGQTPFATAGCQIVDEVARLFGGCVLAAMRGRGGYRGTLRRRLDVSYESGARLALVHARVDTSTPILTRLGFESYGEGRLYTLPV